MAEYLKNLFGGSTAAPSQPPSDDDFADYASAPSPSPIYDPDTSSSTADPFPDISTQPTPVPYTKWYRIWERASPRDFQTEAIILPFILLLALLHLWGRRTNKRKANAWAAVHTPLLEKEFSSVGFSSRRQSFKDELAQGGADVVEGLLKEKSANEYITYATGRQNVAFLDATIKLYKRYNPTTLFMEMALGFLFESIRAPKESMEITAWTFDGKERDLVPVRNKAELDAKESRFKGLGNSGYDACVWAVVHKEQMKALRDERYDISLTATRDHKMLPPWASVMSESAEITEALLTKELVEAIEKAGDAFEYLIISDQPVDKPSK
ncbi:MAG: hypothetical protein Q9183_007660 [Haloplaca sp. 2 TL-2023]